MNPVIERLTGLHTVTDQVIAMDLLTAAKTGMKMYARAVTEAATPQVRAIFEKHLYESVDAHAAITDYMMMRGFYHPYNVAEQIQLDQRNVQTALNIPS